MRNLGAGPKPNNNFSLAWYRMHIRVHARIIYNTKLNDVARMNRTKVCCLCHRIFRIDVISNTIP